MCNIPKGKKGLEVSGNNFLHFGAGLEGKDEAAGKIGYGIWTPDALDIVGGGKAGSTRQVRIWDKLNVDNMQVYGSVAVGGNINVAAKLLADNIVTNKICSQSGTTCLELKDDGFGFVVRNKSGNGTAIQGDGNVVGYAAGGAVAWQTGTGYGNSTVNFMKNYKY